MDIKVGDIVTWALDFDPYERIEACKVLPEDDFSICIGIVTKVGDQDATVKWIQKCLSATHVGNRYEVLGSGLLERLGQI